MLGTLDYDTRILSNGLTKRLQGWLASGSPNWSAELEHIYTGAGNEEDWEMLVARLLQLEKDCYKLQDYVDKILPTHWWKRSTEEKSALALHKRIRAVCVTGRSGVLCESAVEAEL